MDADPKSPLQEGRSSAFHAASCSPLVAALFVDSVGCYVGRPEIDAWPESRDARKYFGPLPVVAHPPCQRWGRFWHGSTRKPHQFRRGEDGGCFAAALTAVRNYGGVLEHPAGSSAWEWFGLRKPRGGEGWIPADSFGGWTCQIDQRHYGHQAPKPTWLYAVRTVRPELEWAKSDRTPPQWMIDRYGESKARKIGQVAMIGGKDKTRIRNATPPEFRDVLLRIASSANEKAHPTAAGGTGGAQKGLWNMSKTSNGKEKRQLRVQRMVRSPVVLSQKQLREYVPGGGCRCAAWNESECACGVDWTPTEIYRLRLTIKSLRAKLRRMRTPNEKMSHCEPEAARGSHEKGSK